MAYNVATHLLRGTYVGHELEGWNGSSLSIMRGNKIFDIFLQNLMFSNLDLDGIAETLDVHRFRLSQII